MQLIDGRGVKDPYWRKNIQDEASWKLSDDETQIALDVAVNGGVFMGHLRGKPGFERGHIILLNGIARDPSSRFYNAVTPEFEGRLINGAFWETLGEVCKNSLILVQIKK